MAVNSLRNLAPVVTTGDPTTVNDATQQNPLGVELTVQNTKLYDPGSPRTFKYVKRASADATTLETNGGAAFISALDTVEVTQDESAQLGGTGAGNLVGFFVTNAITAGNFGWIQIAGNGPVRIVTATTPAIGDVLTPSTTDGQTQATADFGTITEKPCGTVLTLKNAGSIGTHVVEASINPTAKFA
jgi:hypothetical protein